MRLYPDEDFPFPAGAESRVLDDYDPEEESEDSFGIRRASG